MSGTDLGYANIPDEVLSYAMSGTDLGHAAICLRTSYLMSGTDLGYANVPDEVLSSYAPHTPWPDTLVPKLVDHVGIAGTACCHSRGIRWYRGVAVTWDTLVLQDVANVGYAGTRMWTRRRRRSLTSRSGSRARTRCTFPVLFVPGMRLFRTVWTRGAKSGTDSRYGATPHRRRTYGL
eukprot:1331813-Rhodomonas_salina.2